MLYRVLPLLGLLICFAFAPEAAAQRSREKPVEPPPQFKVDGPTRTLALDRVRLAVPDSTVLGELIVHPFCVTNAYPILLGDAFNSASVASYIDVFMEEAAAAGYQLAGRQNSADLFAPSDQQKPELVVGAAIVGATQNGCGQNIFGMINISIDSSISIDWQVFDPLAEKLVFRATNQGTTKLKTKIAADTIASAAALAAFREASKAILADPEFVAAVKVSGAPAAMQPQSAAPSTEIPRVPLHTIAFKDQISDLRHQVVTVLTGYNSGSGFYIADGLVMTNHHVIDGVSNVKIRFYGGRELAGEVIASNRQRDIAIIRAPGGGMLGLPLQIERPQVGAPVYVIGSPLGPDQDGTVTSGIVSAYRMHERGPILQSDVAVNPGNSGGPMFDETGNVVAIVVAGLTTDGVPIGLNFFIPVDDALRSLGISLAGLTPRASPIQDLAAAGGRRIQVSMFPAGGPLKDKGNTQPLTGNVAGVGTAGTFSFARPDGVNCDGRWTTLESKPQTGSLIDKHRDIVGLAANPEGMVGGLAVGACSNGGTFQAEYYVVPGIDNGFGAATDSDGNIYRVIF